MKKIYFALLISLIITECNFVPKYKIEKQVFNFFIDSIINKYFMNYDLCGTFNNEYNDSILKLNLSVIDTLINKKEDATLLRQYHYWGDKDIRILLNNPDVYKINRNTDYKITKRKDIINHFSLSAPLLTNDKNRAVLFFTGYNLNKMVAEQYIYLFINLRSNVNQWNIYVIEAPYKINNSYHRHFFSLIPSN